MKIKFTYLVQDTRDAENHEDEQGVHAGFFYRGDALQFARSLTTQDVCVVNSAGILTRYVRGVETKELLCDQPKVARESA